MRMPKKQTSDFSAISRRSMQRDFQRVQTYDKRAKAPQIKKKPEFNAVCRVIFVGEKSGYYKFRSYIVGKLVRLVKEAIVGGWLVEFVHEDDRKALNAAAGWTDKKREYLLDYTKFK